MTGNSFPPLLRHPSGRRRTVTRPWPALPAAWCKPWGSLMLLSIICSGGSGIRCPTFSGQRWKTALMTRRARRRCGNFWRPGCHAPRPASKNSRFWKIPPGRTGASGAASNISARCGRAGGPGGFSSLKISHVEPCPPPRWRRLFPRSNPASRHMCMTTLMLLFPHASGGLLSRLRAKSW